MCSYPHVVTAGSAAVELCPMVIKIDGVPDMRGVGVNFLQQKRVQRMFVNHIIQN